MSTTLEYATLTDPAEGDLLRDIESQTFYFPVDYWPTLVKRLQPENLRVVRRNGQLIGGLGMYRMGQWFGGRQLPMAGIAAVAIAPDQRSGGGAAFLMAEMLKELHQQGVPLSTLYPSTQRLYRKVGYEQAGTHCSYEMPLSRIELKDRPTPLRKVTFSDGDGGDNSFRHLAAKRARLTNGNLERNEGMWERIVTVPEKTMFTYLIGDENAPEGFVIFYQDARRPDPIKLYVRDMVALSPPAARSLWTFFYDHRAAAQSVNWVGPANDPLLNLPSEFDAKVNKQYRWMLRIVDVKKALSERGYPAGVEGELHLDIQDDVLPANHGRFVMKVADSHAEVEAGGRGDLRIDIRGLAPLYSGLFPPSLLQSTGQLEADERTLALASQIFVGPEPWMPDIF